MKKPMFIIVLLFTLMACNSKLELEINFNSNGGTIVSSIEFIEGALFELPNPPSREGYSFIDWYLDETLGTAFSIEKLIELSPEDSVDLYAKWQINSYTVKFDSDGGTLVSPITVNYNTPIIAPNNPTKEGFSFSGWDIDIPAFMPANNLTLKAKWVTEQFTFTFDTDGGTEVHSITQDFKSNIIPPENPMREGYEFLGWNENIPETMPAENLTFYAQWQIINYGINFNLNNGSFEEPVTNLFNIITLNLELPIPFRPNYLFGGWYYDADFTLSYKDEFSELKDMELYAKWVEEPLVETIVNISSFTIAEIRTSIIDKDNLLSNIRFDLYYGGDLIKSFADLNFIVENLLMNKSYKLEVTYTFNVLVNDITKTKYLDFETGIPDDLAYINFGIIDEENIIKFKEQYLISINGNEITEDFIINQPGRYRVNISVNNTLLLDQEILFIIPLRLTDIVNYVQVNNFGTTSSVLWVNRTINEDVYIAPGTRVLIFSSLIRGDVINYGKLVMIDSIVTGSIYSGFFNFANFDQNIVFTSPDENGAAYISNVNNPQGFTANASNNLPYRLLFQRYQVNNKSIVRGGRLPFYDLYYAYGTSESFERYPVKVLSNDTFEFEFDSNNPEVYIILLLEGGSTRHWRVGN